MDEALPQRAGLSVADHGLSPSLTPIDQVSSLFPPYNLCICNNLPGVVQEGLIHAACDTYSDALMSLN